MTNTITQELNKTLELQKLAKEINSGNLLSSILIVSDYLDNSDIQYLIDNLKLRLAKRN